MLLLIGIAAVTIEQFVHLCRPDFVSKKARPPLVEMRDPAPDGKSLALGPFDRAGVAGDKPGDARLVIREILIHAGRVLVCAGRVAYGKLAMWQTLRNRLNIADRQVPHSRDP